MIITSNKYPELLVTSPYVQFVNGVAEVDEDVAEQLRGLSDFGIDVPVVDVPLVDEPEVTEPAPVKRKSARSSK